MEDFDIDWTMLRRFAGYMLDKLTLAEAKQAGFVQDAIDEAHWELAAKDPKKYVGDPDVEIVDVSINDMSIVDDMMARIKDL